MIKLILSVILAFVFFTLGLAVVLGVIKLCTMFAIGGILGFLLNCGIIFLGIIIILCLWAFVDKISTKLEL